MISTPRLEIPNALLAGNPLESGNSTAGSCTCRKRHASPFPPLEVEGVCTLPVDTFVTVEQRKQVPLSTAARHAIPGILPLVVEAGSQTPVSWPLGHLVPGRVENAHWQCSALKRYMSSLIAALDLDTYPLCDQWWLSHPGSGSPYVVGAFVTPTLRANWHRLVELGLQVLVVVEDYEEGHHHDEQYWYSCRGGRAFGRHVMSGGTVGPAWADENTWFRKRDGPIGDGYYVTTLAEFGPQRLIHIGKVPVADTGDWEHRPTPTSAFHGRVECSVAPAAIALDRVTVQQEGLTPGYDHDPLPRPGCSIWGRIGLWLCRVFRFGWDGNSLTFAPGRSLVLQLLAYPVVRGLQRFLPKPVLADTCPAYYIRGRYATEWAQFMAQQTTTPCGGLSLPPGFYSIGDNWIVRTSPSHPECNYTNLFQPMQQFVMAKGMSRTAAARVLFDLYGPTTVVSCDGGEIDEPPPAPRVAVTVAYKARVPQVDVKVRIARLDPAHGDFTFAEPDADSLAFTLEQRVLQPAGAERSVVFHRLMRWWKERGGLPIVVDVDEPDFSNYFGRKRQLYERTYEQFMDAKAGYNCFLKTEVLPSANIVKGKATRCIQANNKKFNVLTFKFFHKFEEILLSFKVRGISIFAKGKSMPERLVDIRRLCERYPLTASCDFKNFDGHNKGGSYLAEIDFFEAIGLPHDIARSLREARCYGAFEAQVPMRHSGDLFTGSGNCLQAASILFWSGADHQIYCDGDDTLVFTNSTATLSQLIERASLAGHVLTFEEVRDVQGYGRVIPFCQQYFLEFGEGGVVPDVDRLMEKLFNIPFVSREDLERRLHGKLLAACAYGASGIPGFPRVAAAVEEVEQAEALARYEGFAHEPGQIGAVRPFHVPQGRARQLFRRLTSECKCLQPGQASEVGDRAPANNNARIKKIARETARAIWRETESLSSDASCGTPSQPLVCMLTHSQVWTSHFGSPELLVSTRPMSCMRCDFTSFRDTQLSLMASSPSPSTTTATTPLQPVPRKCFNNEEPGNTRSATDSRSTSPERSSGPRPPGGSPPGQGPSSSTPTSGSSPQTQPNRSASLSNTGQRSTPHRSEPSPAPAGSTGQGQQSPTGAGLEPEEPTSRSKARRRKAKRSRSGLEKGCSSPPVDHKPPPTQPLSAQPTSPSPSRSQRQGSKPSSTDPQSKALTCSLGSTVPGNATQHVTCSEECGVLSTEPSMMSTSSLDGLVQILAGSRPTWHDWVRRQSGHCWIVPEPDQDQLVRNDGSLVWDGRMRREQRGVFVQWNGRVVFVQWDPSFGWREPDAHPQLLMPDNVVAESSERGTSAADPPAVDAPEVADRA